MSQPTTIDILAALAAETPVEGDGKCKTMRLIDTIPDDEPGRDILVARVVGNDNRKAEYRTAPRAARLLASLGLKVSPESIRVHRRSECQCFQ